MELQTVAAKVPSQTHSRLRSLLVAGKLPWKTWTEWLRAKEAEAVRGKK